MTEEKTFDQILASVGDKGRYQKRLLFGFYLLYSLVTPWIVLVPIFLSAVPDHWCHVDGKPENVTLEEWKKWTIPWIKGEESERYSQCQQYIIDDDPSRNTNQGEWETTGKKEKYREKDCQNGWDYDKTWYDETLSSRNDWVCEDKHKSTAWLSVGLSGKIAGIVISNRLSDIYGRKIVSFFLLQMFAIFSLLRLYFSHGWLGYLIMFLSMTPFPAVIQIGLVFVTEQIHSSWRPLATAIFFFIWMVGMCLLPLLAWLTRSWIWLTVVTSVPFFFFLFSWPFFQESSRWQASRGRTSDALSSLSKIAEINGKEPPENLEKSLQHFIEEKNKENNQSTSNSIVDIFRSKILMRLVLLLTICWTCNMLVYYALNYNVTNLGGNQFVNFFLLGVVEGPSTLVAWIACQTIGRRFSQVSFFFLVIVSTVSPIFFASSQGVETVICAVISKILIDASFYAFYLQMIEIYPTSHRTTLMGLSNAIVLSFNISTPYISSSSAHWTRLPYLIMACLATVGCIMALFIPETVDNNLPQTISDTEACYSNQPFWSYKGRRPKDWLRHLFPFCYTNVKKESAE